MTAQDVFATWRRGIAEVAQCPNVVVKIGGVFMQHGTGDGQAHSSDPSRRRKACATMC